MRLRTILLTTVAVLWLPLSTHAGIGLTDTTTTAQRGDVEAQLELGILYEFGYGMANNQIAALAWYTLAAQQGNPKAAARRDILKARMPQGDIDKAVGICGNTLMVALLRRAPSIMLA